MDKPVVSENKEFLKKLYYEIFKSGRAVENIPKLSNDKYFDNNNIKNTISAIKKKNAQKTKIADKELYVGKSKTLLCRFLRFKYLASNNPEYAQFKSTLDANMAEVDELVSRIARLDAMMFDDYASKNGITTGLQEIMKNPACQYAYAEMPLIRIVQKIYVADNIRDKLKEIIKKDPKDEYPLARKIKRHFIIHVGLTNTGKTYNSLQRLKAVESGVYLGPLRLLALEVQDTLNTAGVPCSMITGEEEDIVEGAHHVASTVEKLDINEKYDVAVIDECQLVSDSARGGNWVRAILGVQAPEVHLATAPEGLNILKRIIESCGDTYEVEQHERKTKLRFDGSYYNYPKDIQQGDAIIVFSRKKALWMGDMLSNMGIPTSVIYGALPYGARKKQLERFLNKETRVVISTDAIGMGLNLPIKRIIFSEDEKFDGKEVRCLYPPEVKQIAGRAGRMGMYDEGIVMSMCGKDIIKGGLDMPNEEVRKAYLAFPDEIAEIPGELINIIRVWKSIPTTQDYKKISIERYVNLDLILSTIFKKLGQKPSKEDELRLLNIPFDEKNDTVLQLWITYTTLFLQGKDLHMPKTPSISGLFEYETYYKCIELYYSFLKNFGMLTKDNLEKIRDEKERTTGIINNLLLQTLSKNSVGKGRRQSGSRNRNNRRY